MVKRISILLVSLIMALSVAACSSNSGANNSDKGSTNTVSDEKASSGEKVKLTIWLWPGMGIEDQIKEYAAKNNLEVDIQLSPFADVHNNLQTSLAAGSGAPDISAVEVKVIEKFKSSPEQFYNLLDLGAGDLETDYIDWKWKQALTADGSALLGIPTDIGPMAMAYRTDVFEKAGLPTDPNEVAQLINTWDAFIEAGKKVRANAGVGMIDNAASLLNIMVGQGDEKYFKPDGTLILKDNPQVKKAWDYVSKALEANITANIDAWTTEWGTGMTNGDFAVELAPAWMMGFMKSNAPDASGKWNITMMPEGSGNWGGSFLTVPKQSKHSKEAYELIKWLLSPEQQLETFKKNGNFPSTPSLFISDEIQSFTDPYFSNAPVGKLYAQAAELVKPVWEGPDSQTVEDTLNKAITSVEDKQASSEDAWKSAIADIERQMSRK
ncbi:extracellular solute-binding protein [Paenibacillus alkaliterrae]|uniref:ABC transporter substrate-binding protein n=1 Tax=Paenibacillus alkaliterrae TaxID=320909 RepID=UPI001F4118DE|nr:extracellular solute-binding protein [Paenibacillus alkaliterrae]MCF2937386.1 extracellular solute-binding protein [Paenibacillus alkaliterrae]